MTGLSDLVLVKIEQIETLHARERAIYAEIKAMGDALDQVNWDALASDIIDARKQERSASEDAKALLDGFNWQFPDDDASEPVEITASSLWENIAPKLREHFATDKKALQMVDQIDKLSAASSSQ